MSRAARYSAIAAFVAVEGLVVFGSYLGAAIRCCGIDAPWPASTAEWAGVGVFALVMAIPAALIAAGVALIVAGLQRLLAPKGAGVPSRQP